MHAANKHPLSMLPTNAHFSLLSGRQQPHSNFLTAVKLHTPTACSGYGCEFQYVDARSPEYRSDFSLLKCTRCAARSHPAAACAAHALPASVARLCVHVLELCCLILVCGGCNTQLTSPTPHCPRPKQAAAQDAAAQPADGGLHMRGDPAA